MQAKTFPNALAHWLAEEFPHLGGPKVRALFVDEVLSLMDAHLTSANRLQPGQVVWYAVDKTDLPRDSRSMAETRLVPVVLTLVTRSDIQMLARGVPLPQARREIVARVLREADAQGGVLAETDVALLFCVSPGTISKAVRAYEQEHQCILPRRGTVHDLGPSVTHKGLIARKAYLEAKQAPQVAWETNHSLESTERYLVDLMRVYISLKRRDMTVGEAAFATGLSNSLVKEYAALIAELGLTDDELPSIMTALVRTTQTQPPNTQDTSAPAPESTTAMQ
jgi:hypothetical protein